MRPGSPARSPNRSLRGGQQRRRRPAPVELPQRGAQAGEPDPRAAALVAEPRPAPVGHRQPPGRVDRDRHRAGTGHEHHARLAERARVREHRVAGDGRRNAEGGGEPRGKLTRGVWSGQRPGRAHHDLRDPVTVHFGDGRARRRQRGLEPPGRGEAWGPGGFPAGEHALAAVSHDGGAAARLADVDGEHAHGRRRDLPRRRPGAAGYFTDATKPRTSPAGSV